LSNRIFVLNGMSYASAVRGLGEITYDENEFLEHPEEFKLVLFTGGEDVTPELYGETSPKGQCYNNARRDRQEMAIFQLALSSGILMAGICRGIQFLNVMSGGRLMHHISSHAGGVHSMLIRPGRKVIQVNSLHHQMVIPHKDAEIIGITPRRLSNVYVSVSDTEIEYHGREVEAAIFPKTRSFGVQYHPEMMSKGSEGYQFFYKMVENALTLDWDLFIKAYTEGLDNVQLFEVHDLDRSVSG